MKLRPSQVECLRAHGEAGCGWRGILVSGSWFLGSSHQVQLAQCMHVGAHVSVQVPVQVPTCVHEHLVRGTGIA